MKEDKEVKETTLIDKFREALMWCSGSADFGEGGQAREGWLKICQPLIDKNLLRQNDDKETPQSESSVDDSYTGQIARLEIDRDYWKDKAERYAEELPEDFGNI